MSDFNNSLEAFFRQFDGSPENQQEENPNLFNSQVLEGLNSLGLPQERVHEKEIGGRYSVVRKLGEGGMGVVYLVQQKGMPDARYQALKMMNKPSSNQADVSVKRFAREAKILGEMRNQHVIRVHSAGKHQRQGQEFLYYVMDFVQGKSLTERIEEFSTIYESAPHEFQKEKAMREYLMRGVRLFMQTAQGMSYVHSKGVIHRDIKPDNIMVTRLGKPIITDFGLGKQIVKQDEQLSMAGGILGTIRYMPPEQAESKGVDFRSDVYSLGASFYEYCGLGKAPFYQKKEQMALLLAISDEEPESLFDLNEHIPSELVVVCEKAMEKKISRRYQSMEEMYDGLKNALAILKSEKASSPRTRKRVQQSKAKKARGKQKASSMGLYIGAAGVVATLGIGYMLFSGENKVDTLSKAEKKVFVGTYNDVTQYRNLPSIFSDYKTFCDFTEKYRTKIADERVYTLASVGTRIFSQFDTDVSNYKQKLEDMSILYHNSLAMNTDGTNTLALGDLLLFAEGTCPEPYKNSFFAIMGSCAEIHKERPLHHLIHHLYFKKNPNKEHVINALKEVEMHEVINEKSPAMALIKIRAAYQFAETEKEFLYTGHSIVQERGEYYPLYIEEDLRVAWLGYLNAYGINRMLPHIVYNYHADEKKQETIGIYEKYLFTEIEKVKKITQEGRLVPQGRLQLARGSFMMGLLAQAKENQKKWLDTSAEIYKTLPKEIYPDPYLDLELSMFDLYVNDYKKVYEMGKRVRSYATNNYEQYMMSRYLIERMTQFPWWGEKENKEYIVNQLDQVVSDAKQLDAVLEPFVKQYKKDESEFLRKLQYKEFDSKHLPQYPVYWIQVLGDLFMLTDSSLSVTEYEQGRKEYTMKQLKLFHDK